jgi:hypothetical protein
LGSIGIHVEQSGGGKLILRQPSNGLGVNVKKYILAILISQKLEKSCGPFENKVN